MFVGGPRTCRLVVRLSDERGPERQDSLVCSGEE